MNRSIILITCIALTTIAFSIPREIENKASKYKGYDELISNITLVKYKNETYYWVEYSRTLMYSGSLLLDENSHPVRDKKILLIFSIADIIHKNFRKENVEQLREFSQYYSSLANNIRDLSPELANDSRGISKLLLRSSQYLEKSINSFSPQDTENYLYQESKLIKKMQLAYQNSLSIKETENSVILKNYQDSLVNIFGVIEGNRENLLKSGDYMSQNIQSRISSEDKRRETEMILIVITILLLIFVFFLRRPKRWHSSKHPQPPLGSS